MDKMYKRQACDVIPFKQKINFENLRIRTEVESADGGYGQTDGRTKSIKKQFSDVIPFKQKIILKIQWLEQKLKGIDRWTDKKTDGRKSSRCQYPTFKFSILSNLKKESQNGIFY